MTATINEMVETFPADIAVDHQVLAECIAACVECAQACTACADACLSEATVDELKACIRTNLDCADVCDSTGRVLSRHTGDETVISKAVLASCITACRACRDVCDEHSHMAHCATCRDACFRCEEACEALLRALGGQVPSR
jgi:hypothetical protein